MASDIGLSLGAEQAGLETLSRVEIESFFGSVERAALIDRLARVNCALGLGGMDDHAYQNWLAPQFFRAEWIERVNEFVKSRSVVKTHSLLDPRLLRMAVRLALRFSPLGHGRTIEDPETRFFLGHVFLSLDRAYKGDEAEPPDEASLEYKLFLAQLMERQAGLYERSRSEKHALHSFLIGRLLEDDSLRADFEVSIGISAHECYTGLFALQSYFGSLDFKHIARIGATNLDPRRIFGQCRIPRRVGEAVLRLFSFDVRDSEKLSDVPVDAMWNNGWLRNRPYCILADNSVTSIDAVFGDQTLSRGLFTVLESAVGNERVSRLFTPKGDQFGRFCSRVFEEMQRWRNDCGARWHPPGNFCGVAIDGAYEEGSHLVLCEFKSGLVGPGLRFGTDYSALARELDVKYVFGTDKGAKGMAQLSKNVAAILEHSWCPSGMTHPCIWPLLVVEDDFLAYKSVGGYIACRAEPLFKDFPPTVRYPRVISAKELMMLLDRCPSHSPVDILLAADRTMLEGHLGFGSMVYELFSRVTRPASDVRATFLDNEFATNAFESLTAQFQASGAPKCGCDKDLVLVGRDSPEPKWRCHSCDATDRPVTAEDLSTWEACRQADIDWYLASGA